VGEARAAAMRASKPARLFASKCAPDDEEEDPEHLVPAKMKVAQLKVRGDLCARHGLSTCHCPRRNTVALAGTATCLANGTMNT
jgi:hypothetical protein